MQKWIQCRPLEIQKKKKLMEESSRKLPLAFKKSGGASKGMPQMSTDTSGTQTAIRNYRMHPPKKALEKAGLCHLLCFKHMFNST